MLLHSVRSKLAHSIKTAGLFQFSAKDLRSGVGPFNLWSVGPYLGLLCSVHESPPTPLMLNELAQPAHKEDLQSRKKAMAHKAAGAGSNPAEASIGRQLPPVTIRR